MKASKIVKCIDCGKEHPRKELNRMLRCPDFAWDAIGDICDQLMAHKGPYYEKWKQGMRAASEKL